jgi:phosphatidylglycerophosphate synthase
MNLFALRRQLDLVLHPLVSRAARLPLSANQWTFAGACTGLLCAAMFLFGQWWPGLALLVIRGFTDLVDGFVARSRDQRSTFGAVMDDITDRWVLGLTYSGAAIFLSEQYPHVLVVLGIGLTGTLCNVIAKLSIFAEAQQDLVREDGKARHPVDLVGAFGSAEFLVYFGTGVLLTAVLGDPRPCLAGIWAVAIMSHVSLLQRIWFAWRRYRFVDPGAAAGKDGAV